MNSIERERSAGDAASAGPHDDTSGGPRDASGLGGNRDIGAGPAGRGFGGPGQPGASQFRSPPHEDAETRSQGGRYDSDRPSSQWRGTRPEPSPMHSTSTGPHAAGRHAGSSQGSAFSGAQRSFAGVDWDQSGGYSGSGHYADDPADPLAQHDPLYRRWREEQLRALDEDFIVFRRERYQRFCDDFGQWRASRRQQTIVATGSGLAISRSELGDMDMPSTERPDPLAGAAEPPAQRATAAGQVQPGQRPEGDMSVASSGASLGGKPGQNRAVSPTGEDDGPPPAPHTGEPAPPDRRSGGQGSGSARTDTSTDTSTGSHSGTSSTSIGSQGRS